MACLHQPQHLLALGCSSAAIYIKNMISSTVIKPTDPAANICQRKINKMLPDLDTVLTIHSGEKVSPDGVKVPVGGIGNWIYVDEPWWWFPDIMSLSFELFVELTNVRLWISIYGIWLQSG
ncbi:hypothetical protein VNO77_04127 [Canavalia gladiata]|uniref:Uncharacterized protein n=1 Tax=Canavalia gladiata TaxID=3824 RepID=A0AAN9R4J6_CANGL